MSNPNQVNISRNTDGSVNTETNTERTIREELQAAKADQMPVNGSFARVHRGASSVTIRDGETVIESKGRASATTGDIVDARKDDNPGSVVATARSANGRPIQAAEMSPNSIVEVDGMQTTASAAVKLGRLAIDPATGHYVDAEAVEDVVEPEQPEEIPGLPPVVVQVANYAIEGLPDTAGTQMLFNAVTGNLNGDEDAVKRAADTAGKPHGDFIKDLSAAASGIYGYLAAQYGSSTAQAVEMCKTIADHDEPAFKDAMRHLIHGNDARPLLQLTVKVARQLPIDADDLVGRGFDVKSQNGENLVYATDPDTGLSTWVRIEVAAKLGWV